MTREEKQKVWFWLDNLPFLTLNKKVKIYQTFSTAETISQIRQNKINWLSVVDEDTYIKMVNCYSDSIIAFQLRNLQESKVNFICIEDEEYPDTLRNIPLPPIVLYYVGDVSLLKTDCIAIVGTRSNTAYGANVTEKFAKDLTINGFTIVSGLAEGIDSIGHRTCLKNNGKTIAVLAGGIRHIYPEINKDLAKEIEEKGLLISEHKPYDEPLKYNFPTRNRIITGLSRALLVTEASEKSGTRHTVEYAVDTHTIIFAVPGNITSYKSSYTNKLIKSCAACIALSPEDILKELKTIYITKPKIEIQLSMEERLIMDILEENEQVHFDILKEKTKYDTKKLTSLLINMELSGTIKKLAGNCYTKAFL